MDDVTLFEERFEERLRAFARTGVQSVDSAAVAQAVAVGHPKWAATQTPVRRLGNEVRAGHRAVFGPWRSRSKFRSAIGAAVVAVVVLGGAFLVIQRRQPAVAGPSPTADASSSASQPAVVAPSATSSGPSAGPDSSGVVRATGEWITTGSMGTPRSGSTAVRLLDGRVLVAGGSSDSNPRGYDTSAELYDPVSGTWSFTGNMLKKHDGFPATLLRDGKVLVGDSDLQDQFGAEVYDPATGTWTATGKFPQRGGAETATLLRDGKVLITGYDVSELYDPDSGTWIATGKMSTYRRYYSPVLLPNGRVLAAGGADFDSPVDSAELYDPATGSWTATAKMANPHAYFPATLLRDGKVLVAGGDESSPRTPPELYDPATGTWTATGDLARPDTCCGSTVLLLDGTVLGTGASVSGGVVATYAELYDPNTGSWIVTGSMRRDHDRTLTLLLDGTVLVAGGADCLHGDCLVTGSAELYVPAGVSPPTSLPTAPPATPRPSPTPSPTPFPPAVGPVPPNARLWTVKVVNESSKPATLFVADEDDRGVMAQLVGSATPNIVPAGATVRVTFAIPAKGVEGWSIYVNSGPDDGGLVGESEAPRPLEIHINESGQPRYGQPS